MKYKDIAQRVKDGHKPVGKELTAAHVLVKKEAEEVAVLITAANKMVRQKNHPTPNWSADSTLSKSLTRQDLAIINEGGRIQKRLQAIGERKVRLLTVQKALSL
jgi:hypothetical protein